MPWRLIIFILVFAVFLAFVTFNLENRCDISFGFTKLTNVPIFITIFASFIMGIFCSLPLLMYIRKKQNKTPLKESSSYNPAVLSTAENASKDKIKQDAEAAKKKFSILKKDS